MTYELSVLFLYSPIKTIQPGVDRFIYSKKPNLGTLLCESPASKVDVIFLTQPPECSSRFRWHLNVTVPTSSRSARN